MFVCFFVYLFGIANRGRGSKSQTEPTNNTGKIEESLLQPDLNTSETSNIKVSQHLILLLALLEAVLYQSATWIYSFKIYIPYYTTIVYGTV